jgi:hypothetical protein
MLATPTEVLPSVGQSGLARQGATNTWWAAALDKHAHLVLVEHCFIVSR